MRKKGTDFKSKCSLFEKMGKDYRRAKVLMSKIYSTYCASYKVMEESESYGNEKENLAYYENIKKLYDLVLDSISREHAFILRKDFFDLEESSWWLYYYSRSTYYRLKGKAMDAFLEILYGKSINEFAKTSE